MTPHFSLEELTFSETASRHGIDNTPNDKQFANLLITAKEMENVRELLNSGAIRVSSGFRCLALNQLLGSKETSSHIKGLACDFTCQRFGTPNDVVLAIINSSIPYNQLILEYDRWVHISFCEDKETPQKMALIINKEGTMLYSN